MKKLFILLYVSLIGILTACETILPLDILAQQLQCVTQEQEQGLAGLKTGGDLLFVRQQTLQNSLLALLTHGVHAAQVDLFCQKVGLFIQLGVDKLSFGQALLQEFGIALVAIEAAQFGIENFNFHYLASNLFRSFSFILQERS